ncbi:MAG: hypothetical protein Q9227_003734 [Pyrenula ochraceoflavens]
MSAPKPMNGAVNHWDLAVPLSQAVRLSCDPWNYNAPLRRPLTATQKPQSTLKNGALHDGPYSRAISKPPLAVSKDPSLNRRPSTSSPNSKPNGTSTSESLQPSRVEDLKSGGISRTGSEADSLLDLYRHNSSRGDSSLDVSEIRMDHEPQRYSANGASEDEKWIHRDKLAKIEREELQAAGIKLANTPRTSSRTRTRRAPSNDLQSEGTNGTDQESWPAVREEKRQRVSSPVEEEQVFPQEQQNWDLRSPAEIASDAQEEKGTPKIYQSSSLTKSKSRIPVLTASPLPVQDKDTPRPRTRAGSQLDEEQPARSKPHSRRGSAASQTLLNDIGNGTSTPGSPTTTRYQNKNEGSPGKRKVTPNATPAVGATSSSRKVTPASRKVSNARSPSGSTNSPAQRPSTRSGDERPRTAVNRPEGDPPWLATMYKPDPMLPPDQQIVPTHAKRQQQAQWAEDGSLITTYDRKFSPLAIHTDDGLKPSAPPKNSPPPQSPRKDEQSPWPMKDISRAGSTASRPGTSGADRGGYSTMPRVTASSPTAAAVSSPRLSPREGMQSRQASVVQPQTITRVADMPDISEKKGKKFSLIAHHLEFDRATLPHPSVLKARCFHLDKVEQPSIRSITTAIIPAANLLRRLFGTRPASPASMAAAKTKAQKIIDDNPVAVFSKSYCPYCKASKALLSEKGAKYFLMELDQVDDGAALQDALEEITGQRSVPNIFIKQQHIGGNSELQGKKGELDTLLKDANAI